MADVSEAHLNTHRGQRAGRDEPLEDVRWISADVSEASRTFGMLLANRRSSSFWESFPFTMNFAKGVRSITPTFSITSLHSLPTGPNQLVRRKLGLNTNMNDFHSHFLLASSQSKIKDHCSDRRTELSCVSC